MSSPIEVLTIHGIEGSLTVATTLVCGGVPKGAPWVLSSLRYPPRCTSPWDTAPHLVHRSPLPAMHIEERAPNWTLGALSASLTSANNNHCVFLGKSLNLAGS